MKILGIDSSGLVASVAVVEDDILIAEYSIQYKITHSQTLLPMLDEVRERIGLNMEEIDAIAVASGPGSFTGLRIGSATAKGLGLALQKPIVSVPTLDALAFNLWGAAGVVCPIMDARREQVYTGIYSFIRKEQENEMSVIMDPCAMSFDDLAGKLNAFGKDVCFLGDGVPVFYEQMEKLLTVPFSIAPASCNRQRAASVAALGSIMYQKGEIQTAGEHAPEYLRLSQAEREKKEKQ